MSYTKESLEIDINWLEGRGLDPADAEDFVMSLINEGFTMSKQEYVELMRQE